MPTIATDCLSSRRSESSSARRSRMASWARLAPDPSPPCPFNIPIDVSKSLMVKLVLSLTTQLIEFLEKKQFRGLVTLARDPERSGGIRPVSSRQMVREGVR